MLVEFSIVSKDSGSDRKDGPEPGRIFIVHTYTP